MSKYNNITGQKFGKLVAIQKGNGRKTKSGAYVTTWICKCDCGNITEVDYQKLSKGHTKSCGCLKKEFGKTNFEDLTGKKFNRLTFIRFLHKNERKTVGYNWLCRCDCGNIIHANANKVKIGHTKSCGCYEKEIVASVNKKYKNHNKKLYSVFNQMKDRCYNKSNKKYQNYGGRNITVCDEWNCDKGFDNFYEWAMNNGYKEHLTLDRIDNYKGYSPDNCRWITNKQQQNNKRYHRYVVYGNEKHNISEWSDILGMNYNKTYRLLVTQNKSVQEVMNNYT